MRCVSISIVRTTRNTEDTNVQKEVQVELHRAVFRDSIDLDMGLTALLPNVSYH